MENVTSKGKMTKETEQGNEAFVISVRQGNLVGEKQDQEKRPNSSRYHEQSRLIFGLAECLASKSTGIRPHLRPVPGPSSSKSEQLLAPEGTAKRVTVFEMLPNTDCESEPTMVDRLPKLCPQPGWVWPVVAR